MPACSVGSRLIGVACAMLQTGELFNKDRIRRQGEEPPNSAAPGRRLRRKAPPEPKLACSARSIFELITLRAPPSAASERLPPGSSALARCVQPVPREGAHSACTPAARRDTGVAAQGYNPRIEGRMEMVEQARKSARKWRESCPTCPLGPLSPAVPHELRSRSGAPAPRA